MQRQLKLIMATPALRAHAQRRWLDTEDDLVSALAEAAPGVPEIDLRTAARAALQAPDLAGGQRDPAAAIAAVFARLRAGWPEL